MNGAAVIDVFEVIDPGPAGGTTFVSLWALQGSGVSAGAIATAQVNTSTDAVPTVRPLPPVAKPGGDTGSAASTALVRATRAPLHGSPVTNRGAGRALTNTSTAGAYTSRIRHVITEDCLGIHLVFAGWGNGEAPMAQDGVVKAAVEISGQILPVTFGGARTATLTAGGLLRSDPVGVGLRKGDVVWVRACRTFTPGTWINNCFVMGSNGEGSADADVTDSASTAFTVPGSDTGSGWTALSVVSAAPSAARSVAIIGDSVSNGQNETVREIGGYMMRALPDGVAVLRLNGPGGTANLYVTPSGSNTSASRRRLPLAGNCKYAWVEFGINDVNGGDTAATIKANLTRLWLALAAAGLTVVQSTVTVWGGGSTDAYQTVDSQTVWAKNAVRVEVNDWIRTKPAPLAAVFDMADVVESARNSGKWKAAVGGVALTTDGIHPSTVGHTLVADALRAQAATVFV